MTLVALILALLIEQIRPLPVQWAVIDPLRGLSTRLAGHFNGGSKGQGWAAWALGVAPGTLLAAAAGYFLEELSGVLGFAFMVGALYLTLGFRQESHFFTDIHLALRTGGIERARELITEWRQARYEEAWEREEGAREMAEVAIGHALLAAHRNVFGVMFWFVLLGPAGAVMYRLARFFDDEWGSRREGSHDRFGQCARQAFRIIDWIPSRLTALSFALAGNFEDAVFCWRAQAARWPDRGHGILIASGAGALGIRLGAVGAAPENGGGAQAQAEQDGGDNRNGAAREPDGARPEVGVGAEAGVDDMQSTIGLVWRALVVYLLVLALAVIAAGVSG
jgi:adenosylcobinamide-phosphate synthase